MHECLHFSLPWHTFVVSFLLDDTVQRCEVVPLCGFNLLNIFSCVCWHLCVFLDKCLLRTSAYFLPGLLSLLLLIYMCSFYILCIIPFQIYDLQIFHFIGCLYLWSFFAMQKPLVWCSLTCLLFSVFSFHVMSNLKTHHQDWWWGIYSVCFLLEVLIVPGVTIKSLISLAYTQ